MEIVLIEDNEAESDLIVSCLKESSDDSIKIVVIRNGEEAVEYIRENHSNIKIIILDLSLPKMKGDEILSIIKNDNKTKLLPVVIFSTSSNPDDIEKTYSLGTNSFVTKPMGIQKFKQTIKNIYDFWINHNKTVNYEVKS